MLVTSHVSECTSTRKVVTCRQYLSPAEWFSEVHRSYWVTFLLNQPVYSIQTQLKIFIYLLHA